ncbi:MAG: metallophosphoesterase [Oscillospiraceae bacterium]
MGDKKPQKKHGRRYIIHAAVLIIIIALFLDSRCRLVKTDYELSYASLPQSFDGFRIVQLSDLHLSEFGRGNSRLIEKVSEQKPDIIVLTGDFLEKRAQKKTGEHTEKLRPLFEGLKKIAPCYFVSGNHEWASGEIPELTALLSELEIKYLHNEFVLLERENEHIALAGVEDPNGPADMKRPNELAEIIKTNNPDIFTLMLAHRNDFAVKYPDLPVNLILCGHAHGGVVRLPAVGGVFGTELDFFPKYDAGHFNEGGYDLIISRGLGGYVPMPRLFNNPEIVTVILKSAN